ncbi:MAG TPA: uroporphyrinogen decarboxylase family protein [Candidatus Binataceae bacterium]|nr:uroporphyrinogen decarboxylase family protein [Candidatus Binataceae bacterium]
MSAIDTAPARANRLYCPMLFRFAARLEQMTWSEFTSDPADTVAALRNAQTASGADLIVNWFDTWAECDALGADIVRDADGNAVSCATPPRKAEPLASLKSGLLPRLKDIAERLYAERRAGTLIAGFVTGPGTLARRVGGRSEIGSNCEGESDAGERSAAAQLAVQWAIELIRSYGELELDLSIIAEEEPEAKAFYRDHVKLLQPLVNLSRYYRHPLIVLNRRPQEDDLAEPSIGGAPPIGTVRMISEELFTAAAPTLTDHLKPLLVNAASGRILMLSSWEVPIDAEPERLRELGVRLKGGDA